MIQLNDWYAHGIFAEVDGLRIFFRREGQGQALVCIHGFPSSSWDFEAIWTELTKHFDTIASDLVGLGRSAKPKRPISVKLQADIIEKLVVGQGLNEAHLLAHDLGDSVAQELLARQAAGTSSVHWLSCVFLNGGIFPETHRPLLIQKLLISKLGPAVANLTTLRTFRKNMHRVFSKAHPPTEEFVEGTWQLMLEDDGRSMIPRLIRYMRERSECRDRWVAPLSDNSIPIRLINGVEDPVSGAHAADRFEEVVPQADIIRIPESGHYPHVETPREVVMAFLGFHDSLKNSNDESSS